MFATQPYIILQKKYVFLSVKMQASAFIYILFCR